VPKTLLVVGLSSGSYSIRAREGCASTKSRAWITWLQTNRSRTATISSFGSDTSRKPFGKLGSSHSMTSLIPKSPLQFIRLCNQSLTGRKASKKVTLGSSLWNSSRRDNWGRNQSSQSSWQVNCHSLYGSPKALCVSFWVKSPVS